MTKTYQEVLEAIQKANPELMKMDFGCKFSFNSRERVVIAEIENGVEDETGWLWSDAQIEKLIGFKILGKEPQLQHILYSLGGDYFIDGGGNVERYFVGGSENITKYNLAVPFSQQGEAVYNSFHKILCQK